MNRTRCLRRVILLLCLLSGLAGCKSWYFKPAFPPATPQRQSLAHWPEPEIWTGIVFNGAKIGFAHTAIAPAQHEPGHFRIDSTASMLLQFLGFEKRIRLRSTDIVNSQLHLVRFEASYHIDGNDLEVAGEVAGLEIRLDAVNSGQHSQQTIALQAPVIPTSAILMHPVLQGLEVGRQYRFPAFNGETLQIAEVDQRVVAFESSDLFAGEAFKIVTRMQSQETTSWIDTVGRPLFELALNGVLIAALEDESAAKRYLTEASLNKKDVMLEFSIIHADRPIVNARRVARLDLLVRGAPGAPVSAGGQQCRVHHEGWRCSTDALVRGSAPGNLGRYLQPTLQVPSGDPQITALAREVATGGGAPSAQVERILDWIEANIRKRPVDAFSALDVLRSRQAECQGHSYLYTALARALGIPTRVINGFVYSEAHDAFLFHSWAESLIDGQWRAVDPTFRQSIADATHLKIVEGEEPGDLVALTEWVGRVSVEVIGYEHGI